MRVMHSSDPSAWLAQVESHLAAAEAENSLVLGTAIRARDFGHDDVEMWSVCDGAAVVGTALRTPLRDLIVTRQPGAALAALAEALNAADADLPGVIGVGETASEFASHWQSLRSVVSRVHMQQLLYECRTVLPVAAADGRVRMAVKEEIDVIAAWLVAFAEDVRVPSPGDAAREIVGRLIASDSLFVWEIGGELVSAASASRPTPNGISINFVYTPPEHRGRGYATSCVAALTQKMLDDGKQLCCLYTDASNPTTNAIYRRIGYRVVCDGEWIEFAARP